MSSGPVRVTCRMRFHSTGPPFQCLHSRARQQFHDIETPNNAGDALWERLVPRILVTENFGHTENAYYRRMIRVSDHPLSVPQL